jgi:hypothetical protein
MATLIDSSVFITLERRSTRLGALARAVPDELTENLRDFQRIPGLVVRQPTW